MRGNEISSGNENYKNKKIVLKLPSRSLSKRTNPRKVEASGYSVITKGNGQKFNNELKPVKVKRGGKRKFNLPEPDDASRIQRRSRYLLVKMKLEQNLIDAYSTEGWKGQSREKIKPEEELERAKEQILKCKLGLRDAIRQLDTLGSMGCIDNSVMNPDGSVFHEHIFCAKCKLQHTSPDNDIILCDGTCNCAFHQQCLDPPLATEDIPPEDEGWLCKYCDCKLEIFEAMNAHLATCYTVESVWQDIFKEEASSPDRLNMLLNPDVEWPSDDSEDGDYDPVRKENSNNCSVSSNGVYGSSDDGNISTSFASLIDGFPESDKLQCMNLETGASNLKLSENTDESDGDKINRGRRERRSVDYRKMYEEMFGKDAVSADQSSDDEDWGPRQRRRGKESDAASTLLELYEFRNNSIDVDSLESGEPPNESEHVKLSVHMPPAMQLEFGDDGSLKVQLKRLRERKRREKALQVEAEKNMERICELKAKVERLRHMLLRNEEGVEGGRYGEQVMYVPVAVLKHKIYSS